MSCDSYVKDTTHFLQIINCFNTLPTDTWLVTLDVTALYTQIDNTMGSHAAKEALDRFRPQPGLKPSNQNLIKLLEMVLTKNAFQFAVTQFFQQISGTSMGAKCAPSYSICFMDKF